MTVPVSMAMSLPANFNLYHAKLCAGLLHVAYNQYTQWVDDGRKPPNEFHWKPLFTGYDYSAPIYWTTAENVQEPLGFVAVSKSSPNAYLVFRGTASTADIISDLDYWQTDYLLAGSSKNYGRVHHGFYSIYRQISSQVRSFIQNMVRSPSTLFTFVGHSLGSALSTLAIPDVLANTSVNRPKDMFQYNYASPRVGNIDFATALNTSGIVTFRIANTEDIITNTPTPIIADVFLNYYYYKHIGTSVDFTAVYDSVSADHSLYYCYDYAIYNIGNPQSQANLPPSTLPSISLDVAAARKDIAPPTVDDWINSPEQYRARD